MGNAIVWLVCHGFEITSVRGNKWSIKKSAGNFGASKYHWNSLTNQEVIELVEELREEIR